MNYHVVVSKEGRLWRADVTVDQEIVGWSAAHRTRQEALEGGFKVATRGALKRKPENSIITSNLTKIPREV